MSLFDFFFLLDVQQQREKLAFWIVKCYIMAIFIYKSLFQGKLVFIDEISE